MITIRAFFKFVLLLSCGTVFCQHALAQNISNKGKDFWLGYGNHVRGYNLKTQQMVLYITSNITTTGKIEIPGIDYSETFQVIANSIVTVTVPQEAYLEDEGKYNSGIHITAVKPVVVYAHIYDHNISGATLVLPTNVLGKEYYSINYKQVSNQDSSYSYFFVVAVEDHTQVEITPSVNTKGGQRAGIPFYVTLDKGQVFQVLGEGLEKEKINLPDNRSTTNYKGADLTGSKIRSISSTTEPCKKIAVFSGSGKIGIGCESGGIGTSDNLFQQVYPATAWGLKTITVPLASRNFDVIRIVRSVPSATVKVNGSVISFTNDFYFEFQSDQVNVIESDFPVQVVQYSVTQGKGMNCTSVKETTGDPEMIYLNPVEQNIDHITVYSTSAYLIEKQFINVVIQTEAVSGFKLDGMERSSSFHLVTDDPQYSWAQLSVSAGVHTLSAKKGFNAVAYGFGSAESYGYSAGANVRGQELKVINKDRGEEVTSGCIRQPLSFSIRLPYRVNKLTWDFGNGEWPAEVQYAAPEASYQENGKWYFEYSYPNDVIYAKAEDYTIEITAEKTTSDGCGNSDIIQADFSVYNLPEPRFSVGSSCEESETLFTDESDAGDREIKSWKWNFGDGGSSEEQNPKHTYASAGTYSASLTIQTNSGCGEVTSLPVRIVVHKKPESRFAVAGNCQGKKIYFTDESLSSEGRIVSWIWDFGDGSSDTFGSADVVNHEYRTAGTFNVKHTVVTEYGCKHERVSVVVVHPSPVADFTLPEVCLEDSFASFSDLSSIEDHTESYFQYSWDFGEPASGTSNHSAEKNPRHKYSAAGEYEVSLTVTSQEGCKTTVKKRFTVNGSNPVSNFEVENANSLCSNNSVVFKNKSTVDIGTITRLEWYFDDAENPSNVTVDEDPTPGKERVYQYPVFHSQASKDYTVRLKAFSGGQCFDEKTTTITLKAVPQVRFDPISPVCPDAGPFKLSAFEEYGFTKGEERYTGEGVSVSGVFDPVAAGPGMHEITYTFTADNGCSDSQTQSIMVNSSPFVSAGEDIEMREGTQAYFTASAGDDVVTYQWTPSAGLSRSDILNPEVAPFDNTTYTLTVTNAKGCRSSSSVNVRVDKYPLIPNAFSPNGDGINDKWEIRYLNRYPEASVEIFNRYGERIYKSQGYSTPWDGTYNGASLPAGTYYYIIDPKNGMGPFKGYIAVIR